MAGMIDSSAEPIVLHARADRVCLYEDLNRCRRNLRTYRDLACSQQVRGAPRKAAKFPHSRALFRCGCAVRSGRITFTTRSRGRAGPNHRSPRARSNCGQPRPRVGYITSGDLICLFDGPAREEPTGR